MSGLKEKAGKLGRKAFVTHVDGTKLAGKGYETKIWVQRDIDELIEGAQKEMDELKQKLQSKNLLEKLAELEHEQWMEWSKAIAPEINTAYYLPHLERWKKCWVPYSKLTEEQKEYDRVWARKIVEELLKEEKEAKP